MQGSSWASWDGIARHSMLVVVFLLASSTASAQPAADLAEAAETAYVELDYAKCISRASASLKKKGVIADRVRAYKFRGLCQAALNDVDSARESFEAMLAIDIKAKLPEGLSPRFTSSYFEAKGRWIGRESIALTIDSDDVDDDLRILKVSLKDEPELVRYVAWRGDDGEVFDKIKSAARMEMEVPMDDAVDIVAIDRGGVVLRVTSLKTSDTKEEVVDDEAALLRGVDNDRKVEPAEASDPTLLFVGVGAAGALVVVGVAVAVGAGLLYLDSQRVDAVPSIGFNE